MKFADFVAREAVISGLSADTKESVIRSLVQALQDVGKIPANEYESIVKAILKREELGSTGIGRGVAVPHTKHPSASKLTGAVAVSPHGFIKAALADPNATVSDREFVGQGKTLKVVHFTTMGKWQATGEFNAQNMLERVVSHGKRRAAEMREAGQMLDDLGMDGSLSRAVAALPEPPRHVFVDGRDKIITPCDCDAVIGGAQRAFERQRKSGRVRDGRRDQIEAGFTRFGLVLACHGLASSGAENRR